MKQRLVLILEGVGLLLIASLFVYFSQGKTQTKITGPSTSTTREKVISTSRPEPFSSSTYHFSQYDPGKSFAGYTVIPESGTEKVGLWSPTGQRVHEWNLDAARARLLPNGNLLVIHGSKWGWSQEYWRKMRRFVREYSWEGDVVWEYEAPGAAHHDVRRLPNGHTLFLYRLEVPEDMKTPITDPAKRESRIKSDAVLEITPSGEKVWEWLSYEHLDLNSCGWSNCVPLGEAQRSGRRGYDWTHMNTSFPLAENSWFKGGDRRFRPGNILLLPRNWSEVLLLDRESNQIVWRYHGEDGDTLSGGHEAQLIGPGLPGAGNLLLFNNGRTRHRSEILEVRPDTSEIVWRYEQGK
ncbi:MAG: aryl-sulfate sulfotransferase, partial [Bdellovibrionales bacterium]|nr:aryl-sulfate sulfotransferase [Bdellovibrionales bacterium]